MRQVRLLHWGNYLGLTRDDPLDLGYDLPGPHFGKSIQPNSMATINTNLKIEFPVYGRIRRFILRLLFGVNITGIGGIIRPRGGSDVLIGSGVIDAGYRGEILIKAINPTDELMFIPPNKPFAQLIPKLVIDMPSYRSFKDIEEDTKRGSKGGIWK